MKKYLWRLLVLAGLTIASMGCRQTNVSQENQSNIVVASEIATPDWAKDGNIYEVNVRQYTAEGTFNAFARDIPRLREMGVTILWFMPIHPISKVRRKGTLGSYYAVGDYLGINPDYGTLEDFTKMVALAHSQGMHVIIDWVPNHTGWDNPWITNHPDYYTQNSKGEIIDPIDPKTGKSWGWTDVADLNYDNAEMRGAMIQAMSYWIQSAGVDGFRVDVASEVPLDFWREASTALRKIRPDIFMLAEAEIPAHRNEGLFAASYGWSFHQLLNQIAQGKKNANDIQRWYEADREKFKRGYHMNFITNHDENSWNGTEFERMGAAVDALAVLAFTFDGIPLIYSGQEAGLKKRLSFFEKDVIDWGDFSRNDFYRRLLRLRKNNSALWAGAAGSEPMRITTDDDSRCYAFTREKGEDKLLVVLNLSNEPGRFQLMGNRPQGNYMDLFTGEPISLKADARVSLPPWGYMVLTNR